MNKLVWIVKESSAGLMSSTLIILISTTIATLIFHDSLLPYFSIGLTCAILGAIIVNLFTSLFSSFPFAIARIEPAVGGALSVFVFHILTSNNISPELILPTLLFTFASVSILTGGIMYLIGQFNVAEGVRFLPYPVLGGIVSGLGLEILRSGLTLLFGHNFSLSYVLKHVFSLQELLVIVFALVFFIIGRNRKYLWMTPLLIIISSLATYFVLSAQHLSLEQAAQLGWVNGAIGHMGAIPFASLYNELPQFSWMVIFQEWGHLLSITGLVIIITALNVSALEFFGQVNPNIEKEFKITGATNLLGGLLGCIPGNLSLSGSILNKNLGSTSRVAGVLASIFTLIIVLAFSDILSYLCKPVLIAFIISIALQMLYEWLHDGYQKMPLFDYLLMLTILVVLFFKGLLFGLGFGVIVSCLIFIVQYAKTNIVRLETTGYSYTSNVIRPHQQREFLEAHGDEIYIFKLQGYLFFGSIKFLINELIELTDQNKQKLKFLILDFQLVTNIDSSTSYNFLRLRQIIDQENIALIFTHCSKRVLKQLKKMGVYTDTQHQTFPTLDLGLEWCEDQILQSSPEQLTSANLSIEDIIRNYIFDEASIAIFLKQLERIEIPAGSYLVQKKEPSDSLYFVKSGEISIFLDKTKQEKRVAKSGSGTLIGEVGFYLNRPRTASIVAESACVVYRLTYPSLKQLEHDYPDVAFQFHKAIIRVLSRRLIHANRLISR